MSDFEMQQGAVYLVPTPIGNLQDFAPRSIETLKRVDFILAEDTRTTGKLVRHFGIETPLKAHHQHNEHRGIQGWISALQAGQTLGVCSDAGTPGISDPAFLLVRACVENNIPVICLPGPTAFVPALVVSGIPCDRFVFEGFLPHKKGRQKRLTTLADEERTVVFYESPHRIARCMRELCDLLGPERPACVVREISKMFETYHRGTLGELADHFAHHEAKGEIVVVLGGAPK